jgi:AraC family transcriptional regulator, regulatory protein of adaptative response / DNA-3-methyladenine glycosylase II
VDASRAPVRAVVTTGIYCLPPCSGRPRPDNVRLFTSVAGAEAAGYRACHRCRPYRGEQRPPSAASAIVCWAVDLVASGVLDDGGEDTLAARVGVSARHLRRMFTDQIGATPDQLARSRRAHFARRLLDDTDLPISDVAFASGFGSLRQFNREIAATFRAAPRELRRRRRRTDRLVADGGLVLRLPLAPTVDLERRLRELAADAIAGVAAVTAGRYRRTVTHGGSPGVIEIGDGGPGQALLVVHLPRLEGLIHLVERTRRLLDGPAGGFEEDVRVGVARTAGPAAASQVLDRIAQRYGAPLPGLHQFGLNRLFPEPAALSGADLRACGLDAAGERAIRDLASEYCERHTGSGDPLRRSPPRRLAPSR